MVEIRTRILGIAPYDGMRTAMENAAQAYPNVLLDVQTGDLDEGQAIVQNIPPNTYAWHHIPRRHGRSNPPGDRSPCCRHPDLRL